MLYKSSLYQHYIFNSSSTLSIICHVTLPIKKKIIDDLYIKKLIPTIFEKKIAHTDSISKLDLIEYAKRFI